MRKISKIYQPIGSSLCGQACVAMVCDITLSQGIDAVGKKSGTSGPDLAKALSKYGILSSSRMKRLGKNGRLFRKSDYCKAIPKYCIAKVRSEGISESHWILIWDGETFDPYPGRVPWEYISGYIEIKGLT